MKIFSFSIRKHSLKITSLLFVGLITVALLFPAKKNVHADKPAEISMGQDLAQAQAIECKGVVVIDNLIG